MNSGTRICFLICLAEILSMTGTMFFPALIPVFQSDWNLNNTAAGWVSGIFFAGFAFSSPLLVGLTDRIDARRIYLPCAFLAGLSLYLFGSLAEGLWTAAFFRFSAGIGLAGTYMPGLKALSDNISGPNQSRYIVFYTAAYSVGTALSAYFAGIVNTFLGWRTGAEVLALGPIAAILIFSVTIPPRTPSAIELGLRPSVNDLNTVISNRSAAGYMLAYGAHCWELFGFRSWLVAFLAFCLSLKQDLHFQLSEQGLAMLVFLMGVPASLLGNELAVKWERQRAIALVMIVSGILGCLLGFTADSNIYLVLFLTFLYGMTVLLDSGALTAGLVEVSDRHNRGLTLALYSLTGFGMAFLAPLAFGIVLDIAGGGTSAWGLAFAVMGLGGMSGALWIKVLRNS